jgi:hypothetical protein
VCLAVECAVDGVERVEPFEEPATEREGVDATAPAESTDDEHVRPVSPAAEFGSAASTEPADGQATEFEDRAEQFDFDDALDCL